MRPGREILAATAAPVMRRPTKVRQSSRPMRPCTSQVLTAAVTTEYAYSVKLIAHSTGTRRRRTADEVSHPPVARSRLSEPPAWQLRYWP
jgi:hypothetical protein